MEVDVYKLFFVFNLVYFLYVANTSILLNVGSPEDFVEDARLNFTELAWKYGSECEEHDVTTSDGYILKVFHLPGDKSRPVFIMHGLIGSADDFLFRGNTSLAVALADAGYDVWLGNFRGNRYSRRHVSMAPDDDKAFWDFGPDEHGNMDLPAMIDYVLRATAEDKLSLGAFSEGTTVSFMLTSAKPEYNDKLKTFIALSPVVYLNHLRSPYPLIIEWANAINDFLIQINVHELVGYFSPFRVLTSLFCSLKGVGYTVCLGGAFQFWGSDPPEFEPDFVPIMFSHLFSGTSRKNAMHLVQIATSHAFTRFDYGTEGNLREYGTEWPPEYDLGKVRVDTHLYVGRHDKLVPLENVAELNERLTNNVTVHLKTASAHMDLLWGREVHKVVAHRVLNVLKKYNFVSNPIKSDDTWIFVLHIHYTSTNLQYS